MEKFYLTNKIYFLNGVTRVVNELAVIATKDIHDREIAADIEAALERSSGVNVNDINVKVEKGVVTLDGTVPSWMCRKIAHDIAIHTEGVVNTIDRIKINAW